MAKVSQDQSIYSNIKPPPNNLTDNIEPKVKVFTGAQRLRGEKSILVGKNYSLDLPTKEAYAYKLIKGQGGNMLSQLKKSLEHLEGGPWTVQGRDGELTIKNRNYNQRPLCSFTYFGGNGELLSFSAKTTRTEKTLDSTSSTDINPDDKTVNTINTQGSTKETTKPQVKKAPGPEFTKIGDKYYFKPTNLRDIPGGKLENIGRGAKKSGKKVITAYSPEGVKDIKKHTVDDFKATDEQAKAYLDEQRKRYNDLLGRVKAGDTSALLELLDTNPLKAFTVKRKEWVVKWVQPYTYSDYNSYPEGRAESPGQMGGANQDLYWQWNEGYNYLSKGNPNIRVIPKAQAKAWDGTGVKPEYKLYDQVQIAEYEEIEVPIDGARVLASIQPPTNNEIVKSMQEEITGSFRIIGHPELESEKIIEVKNISDRYSGEWYITNLKHRIDQSGYTCEGQAIKKGSTIITNTVASNSHLKGIYAKLARLADARSARDARGITAEGIFKTSFDKYARYDENDKPRTAEQEKEIRDGSYQAVFPKDFGEYNPKKSKGVYKVPIYRANQDIVNIDKSRPTLKEEASKLLGGKK